MKKFVKGSLIAIGIMAAVGGVFCVTGLAMGGGAVWLKSWERNVRYDEAEECFYENEKKAEPDFEENFSGVESLSIQVENAEMDIVTGSGKDFVVKAVDKKGELQCSVSQGTLKIKRKQKGNTWLNGKGNSGCIVLEIPEDAKLWRVDLAVGVGDLNFEGAAAEKLSIECGLGNVVYDGKVDGDVDITCGLGEVSLFLEGESRDFNYSVNCGLGSVSIGGSSYDGIVSERVVDNQADKWLRLDCGIGSASVSFSKESVQGGEDETEKSRSKLRDSDETDTEKEFLKLAESCEEKAGQCEEEMDTYREKAEQYFEKGQEEEAASYEEKAGAAGEKLAQAEQKAEEYRRMAEEQEEET